MEIRDVKGERVRARPKVREAHKIGTLFLKQGTLLRIPFLRRGFLSFMLDTCLSFAYYPKH